MIDKPPEPYELKFRNRERYLRVRVDAERTNAATALDYWKRIIAKCRSSGMRRLMVVHKIPGGMDMTDTFTVASTVTEMGIGDIKIAFADPLPENYETHQFGQMVGTNRGARFHVFTTEKEAENWLLQGT